VNNAKYLSPKQRRLRNRQEMTTAIVETARDIMREQGVASLNLNEIARRLGMQTPSLYEYFPNKMALYDHLFRLGTRLFIGRISQASTEPYLSPWDQIERVLTAYLQCAIDNPELFKLVYERHIPGFAPSEESMTEARAALEEANEYLQSFLKSAQLDPAANIEQMRDFFIALMHGITALHLANNPDQPVGRGRFGSLIPLAIEMLKKAWSKDVE
jgi:AcrR family transcriptional regulator